MSLPEVDVYDDFPLEVVDLSSDGSDGRPATPPATLNPAILRTKIAVPTLSLKDLQLNRQRPVSCPRCNHLWTTRSIQPRLRCSECGQMVRNPHSPFKALAKLAEGARIVRNLHETVKAFASYAVHGDEGAAELLRKAKDKGASKEKLGKLAYALAYRNIVSEAYLDLILEDVPEVRRRARQILEKVTGLKVDFPGSGFIRDTRPREADGCPNCGHFYCECKVWGTDVLERGTEWNDWTVIRLGETVVVDRERLRASSTPLGKESSLSPREPVAWRVLPNLPNPASVLLGEGKPTSDGATHSHL